MTQGGQYLRCDRCNNPDNDFSVNLPWNRKGETYAAAEKAGWIINEWRDNNYTLRALHYCPHCKDQPE
jgi:hypothetical protein